MSKKEDMIEAAKALLWEVGYEAMSPADVLKRSGAGQGSLYHHFEGKQALAAAALDEIAEEMSASVTQTFSSRQSPMRRVQGYLRRRRDGLRGCRLGRLASESAIFDPALRAPVDRYFTVLEEQLRDTLAGAKDEGALPDGLDPAELALSLVAVIQGGYVLSRIHGDTEMINRVSQAAARLIEAAIATHR